MQVKQVFQSVQGSLNPAKDLGTDGRTTTVFIPPPAAEMEYFAL